MKKEILRVNNLGPIKNANIELGDLTLFIGPQASGKSILLQTLKLIIDRNNIPTVLKNNNYNWNKEAKNFLDLFYGEEMSFVWKQDTKVKYKGISYKPEKFLPKQGVSKREEKLFYIPAQRVVTMSQGWPRGFGTFDIGDPFVMKQFSETIRVLMEKDSLLTQKIRGRIFPKKRKINVNLRKLLEKNIFNGATIESDNSSLKKRFLLKIGKSRIPYMTWSTGQKEFMPLLLSFYHLFPSAKVQLKNSIKWVIIEEPEMGLHPKAIESILIVFLTLVSKGYKLIVSTHSTMLLELIWTLNYIKKYGGNAEDLIKLFSIKDSIFIKNIFQKIISQKTFQTYYFDRKYDGVHVKDISKLDIDDSLNDDWGGLTHFASMASEIVSKLAVNTLDEKK